MATEASTIFNTVELNASPDLSMNEITKSLFNNKFLSDVTFKLDTNTIYAHSWELKKRSVVFQQDFNKAIGDQGVINITDTQYATFYEFVRFIYTDECDIDEYNRIELLKLAMKYKIVRLETKLVNGLSECLDVFEFCVLQKYDLLFNMMREWIENELHSIEGSIKFKSLPSEVLEEILKLDYLKSMEEINVFELLQKWISFVSERNKIPLTEQRSHFDKLIRLIRFPSMSIEQFTDCANRNIDLFSKQDIIMIFRQITMGPNCPDKLWNSKPRLNTVDPHRVIAVANHWEIKLIVLSNIVMRGIRFGYCNFRSNFKISVTGKDVKTSGSETFTFNFDKSLCNDTEILVNLGETIVLKPNFEYTIEVDATNGLKVPNLRDDCRPKIQDICLNLSQPEAVRRLTESPNLLEIIFKVQEEQK